MPYLIPCEVVELLLHRQHSIRIFKCVFYPVWLNRGDKRVMFTKISNTRSSGYPPYECLLGWCSRGDLVGLLGGLLGVAALELAHPPCLDHWHAPLDHCPPFEVAHLLDLLLHHLEPHPHLGLVEMLAWRKMFDLVLVEALQIP
jgi:hypothetical protein